MRSMQLCVQSSLVGGFRCYFSYYAMFAIKFCKNEEEVRNKDRYIVRKRLESKKEGKNPNLAMLLLEIQFHPQSQFQILWLT